MSLKEQINKLQNKGLELIQKYSAKIIGLLILGTVLSLGVSVLNIDDKYRPSKTSDYAKTSVMLLDIQMTGGGSGVVLRSDSVSSEILTNKHVCRLLQGGGIVVQEGKKYLVDSIKKYPKHDLCLVKIQHSLGVSTKVSDKSPSDYTDGLISGHPALLPHVLTKGSFSGREVIQLVVGLRECTKEDMQGQYALYCVLMGGFPIIESFQSQLVTGTILPGSSGSGVFNEKGEISGLVFAGNGEGLGYAFIVPHEYIVDFLKIESQLPYERAQSINYDKLIRQIFDKQKNCNPNAAQFNTYKEYCKQIEKYQIWDVNSAN